jgi:5-methylcytosine-specific restriction endonuclease McrA
MSKYAGRIESTPGEEVGVMDYYPIVDYFYVTELKNKSDLDRYIGTEEKRTQMRKEYNAMSRQLFVDVVIRDGPLCKKCGSTQYLTVDHIRPIFQDGNNELSNLQILCKSCNSRKGAR